MEYKVDGWNNFCRVFKLPRDSEYPKGFCFGGGELVGFRMVDWFNPVPGMSSPTITKGEWADRVGDFEEKIISGDELEKGLLEFLKNKQYVEAGRKYLVLCNFGMAFTFTGT